MRSKKTPVQERIEDTGLAKRMSGLNMAAEIIGPWEKRSEPTILNGTFPSPFKAIIQNLQVIQRRSSSNLGYLRG
jgi:hypothetical protein